MQKHIKLPKITVKDGYTTCRNVHGTLEVEFNRRKKSNLKAHLGRRRKLPIVL